MSHPVYDVASAAFAAGGVVALVGDVNGPSNANHVDMLTGPGTGFVILTTGTHLRLDGSAGVFPATGLLRSKTYAGAQNLWTGDNGAGPSVIVRQSAGATLTFGDEGAASGWFTNLIGFSTGIDGRVSITLNSPYVSISTFGGVETARFDTADSTLKMVNAAADPAIPAGGPKMYGLAGALKAIGTGGTITTMAFAEPHCPVCGCDFATEHENREKGYGYLAICLSCMANFIQEKFGPQAWIRREKV